MILERSSMDMGGFQQRYFFYVYGKRVLKGELYRRDRRKGWPAPLCSDLFPMKHDTIEIAFAYTLL